MTTFAEMSKFTSIKDFTADTIRGLIGEFRLRGKVVDLEKEDPVKLINRIDWIINRVGRVMPISGKLDPNTTSFKLDRDADNLLHVRFIDMDGNMLYRLDLGEKDAEEFQYIVTDADGNEVVRDHKWKAVAKFFAPSLEKSKDEKEIKEEVPIKEAAHPKTKNNKTVATQPAETIVDENFIDNIDNILQDEVLPENL